MRVRDITRRAGRSLKNAKARTLLTSLAIGVGAFTIMLSLAAGTGGREYASDIVSSNTNVRELYVQPKQDNQTGGSSGPREYDDTPTVSFGGGFNFKLLKQADIDTFESLENVTSVTPVYNVTPKYVTREGEKKYQTSMEAFLGTLQQEYLAGNGDDVTGSKVILPDSYRKALGFDSPDAAIGATVDVVISASVTTPGAEDRTYSLEVVGVTAKSDLAALSGQSSLQASNEVVKEMYQYAQQGTPIENAYMAATVLASSEDAVEELKKSINDKGYDAQTAEDLMGFIFQFINVLQGVLIGFGALAVLTSIFGIINTQYISVLERTQQIGLMKALGMRRRDVGRLFKIEAAWIGFLGGAIGSGLAFAVGTAANPWIRDILTLGEKTNLLIFEPWTFAAVIIGLMIVSVGAGILPARKAAKLDPIEALRTE